MKNSDKTYKGYIAVLLWSTSAAFVRTLSEVIGPFTSSFLIYTLGGILTLILNHRGGKKLQPIKKLSMPALISGIIYVIYVFTTSYSIAISKTRLVSLGVTVVKSLWPIMTLLLSIPMLREKRKLSIPGLLFSFAGVIVVVLGGSGGETSGTSTFQLIDIVPFLIGFISSISWALYSNIIKKYSVDDSFLGLFMIASGFIMGFLNLFSSQPSNWSTGVVVQIVYQAVITICLATNFWNQSMIEGDINKVTIAANYTPLLSVLISSMILRVRIDPYVILGGAFLVIANVLFRKVDKREAKS